MPKSRYRTPQQDERIRSAEAAGYVWERDSDYQLRRGRGRNAPVIRGCLSILVGKVTGHRRAMVVYPDAGVTTQACEHGSKITFDRNKLTRALQSIAARTVDFRDEDEHFIESQQR